MKQPQPCWVASPPPMSATHASSLPAAGALLQAPPASPASTARSHAFLATLVLSYMGIYLCRKNLSVAAPLLQNAWGLTKSQVGLVASVSTLAYACGKILLGPVVDRLGGRFCLLASMSLVAMFGAAGAFAPSLAFLTIACSANRFCGAASWGSMVKLVPEWFPRSRLSFALGLLSLSFVFGGAVAVAFAGWVARRSGDDWQAILGVPSLVLLLLVPLAWLSWKFLPAGGHQHSQAGPAPERARGAAGHWGDLLLNRQFLVVCALSFTLTFMRETFNFWTVDFIMTEGGSKVSSQVAALLSAPFDLCGAAGIILLGWIYGRLDRWQRQWLVSGQLALLALLLAGLPGIFSQGFGWLSLAVGLIGFLVYGPYSLLAGVLAIEVQGPARAATVAGWVDGVGYLAGVLSGQFFGWLLERGGYRLGFQVMAGLTLAAAWLCLFLYPKRADQAEEKTAAPAQP